MAIEARVKEDPIAAREALRRMLDNGRIEMHPQPDGSYRAESVIFPLILAWKIRRRKARKPRKSETAEASEVVENDGCAGAIHPLYTDYRLPMALIILKPADRRRDSTLWKRSARSD
ncbi:MAG: hypothetical protein JRI68_17640 [Deltaproteobacteria bacterium]|nr:hypothetical protein [Deltaproteobacteria bacterium]